MEGAGSLRLANWLAQVARATARSSAPSAGRPVRSLLGQKAAQFSGTDFTWIAAPTTK